MKTMNRQTRVPSRNKVGFVVNRIQQPHKQWKSSMSKYRPFYPWKERAVMLIDYQPQILFGIGENDGATLQLEARQNERKRIAQELHDTLLQGFEGVALKLDALTNSLPPALSKTKEQLQRTLEQIDQYLTEARRAVWKLRSN